MNKQQKGCQMRYLQWCVLAVLIFSSAGCAWISGGKAEQGKAVFSSLQSAVLEAAEKIESSVVYVQLEGVKSSGGSRTIRTTSAGGSSRARSVSVSGVILTAQGHILISAKIKPDEVERIIVWVDDVEYSARVVKADDQLGMTIIKISTEGKLTPINRERLASLETGSWCVAVTPSGEERDFTKFSTLGVCRGEIAGRYRKFQIDKLPSSAGGAPVVDLDGILVGFVQTGGVISVKDLNDDLQSFLDDATGVTSPEEEARRKGRIGVMLRAISKEYAQAHDLPRSGLWVTHVMSDGPADTAGLEVDDLIVALNGEPLKLSGKRAHNYFMKSLRPRVGSEFSVTVIRSGEKIVCKGVFDKEPEDETLRAKDIGIEVKSITEADALRKNLFSSEGVLITDVEGGSPAATSSTFRSGLLSVNDVILEVDGKPTPTLAEFARVLDDVRRNHPDVLLVYFRRGMVAGYAGLNLKIGENGNGGSK